MNKKFVSEKEFLDLINHFTSGYLHHHNVKDLIDFALSILSVSEVINKIVFYELDTESFDFKFITSNSPDIKGDDIFQCLVKHNVIVKTLSELESTFFIDEENDENYICIPMLSFDGIIGILVISSKEYDIEQNELLKDRLNIVANILALSINSLTSYIDKEHYKDLQDQFVALKTIELRKNEHKLKLRMDQLTTNLNRSIPHEIRTPFLHIIGLSEMLLKHPEIDSLNDSVEIKDIANDINNAAKRLNTVLDSYIYYANLVTKSFSYQEIENENHYFTEDVDSVLYVLLNELAYRYNRTQDIIVNVAPATIYGSPSMINKLFYEVFDNSFKFSKPGTRVEVTANFANDFYNVKIIDHGRGMTTEEVKNIGPFVQFNRDKMEQQGLGLGLAIAIKILAILNGDIDIKSHKDIYTEVTLKLKKYKMVE